ncbi:MAG: phytanoyl-CoA dioxygenase family protein [Puia sp.]
MKIELSSDQIGAYGKDGYLLVRGFFNESEISKLSGVAVEDDIIKSNSYDVTDENGKKSKLALWFNPGDDIYGLLSRSERIVHSVDSLLAGSDAVCHFHSKLMQKEPKVGGAWEWHQDYGYWYKNEFLFPDQMISVMVAITTANRENGCLQVIPGSHKMGRVEHGKSGEQVGASMRYVELALKTMDLVYVELNPGDILFFHSNLLHRSDANNSDTSRWSMISCYNRASNIPYNEKSTSCITPLKMVDNERVWGDKVSGISENADFLTKELDESLK